MFKSRAEKIAKLLELRKDGDSELHQELEKNETPPELNSNFSRADAHDNTSNKIMMAEDGQEVGGISESLAESNRNMNYYCTDADEDTLNKIVMDELCQEIGGISELHEESNNNIVCTDEDENTIITIVMNGNCQGGSETSESVNAEASTESDFNAEVSEININEDCVMGTGDATGSGCQLDVGDEEPCNLRNGRPATTESDFNAEVSEININEDCVMGTGDATGSGCQLDVGDEEPCNLRNGRPATTESDFNAEVSEININEDCVIGTGDATGSGCQLDVGDEEPCNLRNGRPATTESDFNAEVSEININEDCVIGTGDATGSGCQLDVGDKEPCNPRNGRPAKGRKRKHENETRESRKKKKNSNSPYINYKDKLIDKKVFDSTPCPCKRQCYKLIGVENAEKEFQRFWSLGSYDAQTTFIAACVSEAPKKRTYGHNTEKRMFSRTYTLDSIIVCREMFCKSLGITPCRINTALKKFNGRAPITDQRGQKQGGFNKLPSEKVQDIVSQIERIPKYVSHYCRKETTKEYLPVGTTLQKMYDVYCEEVNEPVSFSFYKKVFYEKFNLKTKALKKDTCNICDTLTIKIRNEKNDEQRKNYENEHKIHLDRAEEARKLLKRDMILAKENENIECLTFDLEKTLPLPRVPTNILFYKRQIWVYNAGIHSGKDKKDYCYVWVEGVAGRGAQEIGSCIAKHASLHISEEIEHLILWSDACGGQNRNIKLTLFLKSLLHSKPTLKTITLKFLCSGHSFLPNDAMFGDIECALKHQQRLYLPTDYMNVMRSCRKKMPLIVYEMKKEDFFSTVSVEKKITNRKISADNRKVNWFHIRQIKLKCNEPFHLYVMMETFTSSEHVIDIKKRAKRNQERPEQLFNLSEMGLLWPIGKPIQEAKLKDLLSIKHLIPADAQFFYESLENGPTQTNFSEDIEGYNVANLDFETESQ